MIIVIIMTSVKGRAAVVTIVVVFVLPGIRVGLLSGRVP
jgi:hypothetical protein